MRLSIPLLINPNAGSLFRSGLKSWLDAHRDDFSIVHTHSAEDLTEKAAQLAAAGEPIVAAAGGDGTLMCAAQGLMGTKTALGILPCGTMNVFARELGIGSRRFDVALDSMQNGLFQAVDIFAVNGKPFLQMAGFGMDARIIKLITPKMKRWLGAASHVVTAMQVAVERHPVITVTLPNGEAVSGTQVILGNGKRYGGEAHLFAGARYDDGLLDAIIMHQESTTILFEVLGCMLQQGATNKNVSTFTQLRRFESCVITAESKLDYQLDGDYVATIRPGESAVVERLPRQLKVCIPRVPVPVTAMGRFAAHPMVEAWRARIKRFGKF